NIESPDEKKIVQNIFIQNPDLFVQLITDYFPNYIDNAKIIVKEIFIKNPALFIDLLSHYQLSSLPK
ncbi:MAG TPA: hypothetical protein PLD18_04265, partial [Flavobacterium sp.]|nr:hypothetical protein [Flavobacterium sp.]